MENPRKKGQYNQNMQKNKHRAEKCKGKDTCPLAK